MNLFRGALKNAQDTEKFEKRQEVKCDDFASLMNLLEAIYQRRKKRQRKICKLCRKGNIASF